jgi:hypothetical protein
MLEKKGIDVSFAEGLDTKSDPKRVKIGNFVQLENTVFQKGGLLQKRNGYARLTSLPNTSYSYLTTFKDNLTAIGPNIAAYNDSGDTWVEKGNIQPLSLKTLPVVRNNLNQTAADIAVAPNGAACAVYLESDGSTTRAKYVVFDVTTGQNLSAPALIPVSTGTVTGGMRVFVLGNNFVLVFTNVITATSHLQYISVNAYNPAMVSAEVDVASSYISATTLSWDGFVVSDRLYLAYNTTSGGQQVKVTYLTVSFTLVSAVSFAGEKATIMSVTADTANPASPVIYASYYDSAAPDGFTLAVDQNLNTLLAPTLIIASGVYLNLTSVANDGVCAIYGEVQNAYSFASGIPSNYVNLRTVTLATTAVSSTVVSLRSVGLASKAFIVDGVAYYLAAFQSPYQPTYFLVNGSDSTSAAPVIVGKLAYENGGGYLTTGLPSVTVTDDVAQIAYRFKDLIQAVNKNTNVPTGTQTAGIYSQTGINLATFAFGTAALDTAEIGNDLHLSGGFLGMYDGYLPVEHNFFVWPDTDQTTPANSAAWSATGGSMASHPQGGSTPDPNPGAYYYQFTYEWTDNQGNAFRSAPSIPVAVSTTGTASIGSVTLHVPTLRLTMKTANPVKIVIYRWSLGQQVYYQVTSITAPTLNSTTSDSITFVDTLADATILGNNILYTTGGVVEDVNAPASDLFALFDTRLWLVDGEDRNTLWFSKQVIKATPVEMSDLFTYYVPPTVGMATGEITSIAPMDDKLIISKGGNGFVYVNGTGPDNTGAGNQYSQPIFITSTVGCANQRSIAFIPQGMMFESNKGIWLLARNLDTSYIGAQVESFTQGATVTSAVTVPETNQVRFTLSSGITLMYDYFYGQWGTFVGVPAVSSCIWQDLHAFVDQYGRVFQESPGTYLDGSNPVLMRFKTGPLRLGDLQAYQRAYFFYFLGTYLSPHKLLVTLFYDYADAPAQSVIISPTNYSTPFGSGGSQSPFGQGTPFGGPTSLEDWRIFFERQRCSAVNIACQEVYDPSLGAAAGAGLTLSGINAVLGYKKGYRPQAAIHSAG